MRPPVPPTGAGVDFSRLHDNAYRKSIMLGHAMRSEFYRAETAVTNEVYETVYADVLRGSGGTVFSGPQRFGKTHGSYVVYDRLIQDFPALAMEFVVATDQPGKKYEEFCRILLERFGHATQVKRAFTNWERLVVDHVRTACLKSGERIFYLVVDEAQRWRIEQYRHLFNLSNILAGEGYRLATILFAQSQDINHLIALSRDRDHREIIGRFFVRHFAFRGLLNRQELRDLLDQYDTRLFYPINASEWPYARFYAPERFDEGWRLAGEADAFWAALVGKSGAISELSEGSKGIGMTWIARSIHHYLTDELMGGDPEAEDRWESAIDEVVNEILIQQ